MSKYLDPKADLVFKKIFGEHPHLLKSFLNAILPLETDRHIESLEYLSAEQIPQIPALKRTIVDVKCTDNQGRIFIVEMQLEWVFDFKQRMLFNASHAYVKQLFKGEDFRSLCPVYGVGILNQIFEPDIAEWYHHYKMVNVKKTSKVLDGLELLFLELPKFKPTSNRDKKLRILWLRFLSELDERTRSVDPALLAVPEIEEACKLSEEAAYSFTELEAYNSYWDYVSTEKTIRRTLLERGELLGIEKGRIEGFKQGEVIGLEKGQAIGLEKGQAIGLEKGEAIGLEKGQAIGLEKGQAIGLEKGEAIGLEKGKAEVENKLMKLKIHFAEQMLARGLSVEEITSSTGLELSLVQDLAEALSTGQLSTKLTSSKVLV